MSQNNKTAMGGSWITVAKRELADLWMGGKALILVILFSIFLSIFTFLLATNSELGLIPPKEVMFLVLQITIAFSLLLGFVLGGNAISGERDNDSLEMLLLAPTSPRSLILGKFIAAASPWPVIMLISIPYLFVLKPDSEIFIQSLVWGGFLGTTLVCGFTAIGVIVSFYSNSNRTSLTICMFLYLGFLTPTQLPGTAQTGAVGIFIKKINPMESTNQFLEKIMVNNRSVSEMREWLTSPIVFMVFILVFLFWYLSPKLRLFGGFRE